MFPCVICNQLSAGVFDVQTVIDQYITWRYSVSISLFNSRRKVLESVNQTINATKNDPALTAILIIVEDPKSVELSEIKLNHIFDVSSTLIGHNIAGPESGNIR
jgi:acetolactate synthase regulatory subunit